ncbi:MAG: hypothetical protein WC838_06685 [Candidatus Margulisiibacteriota bacterium]|jgi:hypothetical protein
MFKKTLLGITLLSILTSTVLAVPNQLTYSGRLLQNGALVNATLPMIFSIHTDPTTGIQLWSQTISSVEVNQGIYSVLLGEVGNFISPNVFVTDNAYLQVVVNGETLSPRTKINSVGYALQAGGLSAGGITAVAVSTNGYVGIGTMTPEIPLDVSGSVRLGTNGLYNQIGFQDKTNSGGFAVGSENDSRIAVIESVRASGSAGQNGAHLRFFTKEANGILTHRMSLRDNGTIGIGIATAPSARLHMVNSTTNPLLVETRPTAGAAYVPALFVGPSGNVGIGTTSPGVKLDILGVQSEDLLRVEHPTLPNYYLGLTNSGINVKRDSWSANVNASWTTSGNGYGANSGGFAFSPKGVEAVRIDGGGSVGIGITNPGAMLDVNVGSGISSAIDELSDYGTSLIKLTGGLNNSEKIALGTGMGGVATAIEFGRESSGWNSYISFLTNAVTSGPQGPDAISEKLRITSAGNVGISTTSPAAKLAVNGGVHVGGDSDPGDNNLQVDGSLQVSGVAYTLSGGASCATGVWTNILTLPSGVIGAWLITVSIQAGGAPASLYSGTAIVMTNQGDPAMLNKAVGDINRLDIRLSGSTIQAIQNSGNTNTIAVNALRLMN